MKFSLKKWLCVLTAVCLFSFPIVCTAAETGSNADSGKTAEAASEAGTESKTEAAAEAGTESKTEAASEAGTESKTETASEAGTESKTETASDGSAEKTAEKNGEVYVLCTSDVHCGIDQGFGYAGLQQVRDTLEAQGYETILVDDGDAIQGEQIGTLSKGEAIVDLMNKLEYDVAIPGNHEYDYGVDNFMKLVEKAEYPYISCNFTYQDKLVLDPYLIKEVGGLKIAFVGMTTPMTLTSASPSFFQNEKGEFVYGFMQDKSGEKLYQAVQKAVDDAKSEGADLVYALGHMGNVMELSPYTYADVISNTKGIDAFMDGHSHDTDQVVMKNKDGEEISRCAVGTKMNCIGYSHISADGKILETGIWSWPNSVSAPELLNIQNKMSDEVAAAKEELLEETSKIVAHSDVDLTVYDPEAKDSSGNPVRMIRRAETNLGDFCADAYRHEMNADIGVCNGGGIRDNLSKGDITYGDIIKIHPFCNNVCVIEATGQQILDALEWSVRLVPGETGGFLQVSGISFEVNVNIDSPCKTDEDGLFAGVEGERRVQNVKVGDEAIDPEKTYTVAGNSFILLSQGNGFSMFTKHEYSSGGILDSQVLIDYITGLPGSKIGEEYADPYGQGRIKIIE